MRPFPNREVTLHLPSRGPSWPSGHSLSPLRVPEPQGLLCGPLVPLSPSTRALGRPGELMQALVSSCKLWTFRAMFMAGNLFFPIQTLSGTADPLSTLLPTHFRRGDLSGTAGLQSAATHPLHTLSLSSWAQGLPVPPTLPGAQQLRVPDSSLKLTSQPRTGHGLHLANRSLI